jgi:hypothetical protein
VANAMQATSFPGVDPLRTQRHSHGRRALKRLGSFAACARCRSASQGFRFLLHDLRTMKAQKNTIIESRHDDGRQIFPRLISMSIHEAFAFEATACVLVVVVIALMLAWTKHNQHGQRGEDSLQGGSRADGYGRRQTLLSPKHGPIHWQ